MSRSKRLHHSVILRRYRRSWPVVRLALINGRCRTQYDSTWTQGHVLRKSACCLEQLPTRHDKRANPVYVVSRNASRLPCNSGLLPSCRPGLDPF